jgi:electron transfer flavoprotein alpha subunit
VAECAGRAVLVGSGLADAVGGSGRHRHRAVALVELGDFQPGRMGTRTRAAMLADDRRHACCPARPTVATWHHDWPPCCTGPCTPAPRSVSTQRIELARNGGRELHTVVPGPQFVATLQPGVRGVELDPALPARSWSPPSRWCCTGPTNTITAVLEVQPPDPATIDLAEAPRIVGGGAGLDGPERIRQAGRVGTALGASMGATRVVTDRGWVPHERQIGTTGVVVDPRLYLAFGVSGAVQHTSGLGNPTHIISVNTDQHCPMMQLADLAVVADANATLAALEALLAAQGRA